MLMKCCTAPAFGVRKQDSRPQKDRAKQILKGKHSEEERGMAGVQISNEVGCVDVRGKTSNMSSRKSDPTLPLSSTFQPVVYRCLWVK